MTNSCILYSSSVDTYPQNNVSINEAFKCNVDYAIVVFETDEYFVNNKASS